MTIDCVAYLMIYELEVYVYGASNAVLYCMDSTLQRLRAVCAVTARLLFNGRRPTHQTKIDFTLSDAALLYSGVIQGSGIGPLMFLV